MQMYTGTRLTTAIHRRLLSRFFLREGGRLYTGYGENHSKVTSSPPKRKEMMENSVSK